jgi:hypothetical protein
MGTGRSRCSAIAPPGSAAPSASTGRDKPGLNEKNVDWTYGCISISNADVEDLSRLGADRNAGLILD